MLDTQEVKTKVRVGAIPTFIVFNDDKEVARFTGWRESELLSVLSTPHPEVSVIGDEEDGKQQDESPEG